MWDRESSPGKGDSVWKGRGRKAEGMIEEELIELWNVGTKKGFVLYFF